MNQPNEQGQQETGHRLQTAFGDVRVTAGGIRPAAGKAAPGSAGAFVAELLERHLGRLEYRQGLGLVFRQLQPSTLVQECYQRTHLQLAPRLALTFLAPPQQAADSREEGWPQQGLPQVETHSARQLLLQPAAVSRSERLVYRLVSSKERVEVGTASSGQAGRRTGTGAMRTPTGTFPPTPPVPQVVYRPRAGATSADPMATDTNAVAEGAAPPAGPGTPRPVRATGQMPELGSTEIRRLTDQVIRSIDQRIIAQRERLGRI